MQLRLKINLVDADGRPFMGPGTLRLLEAIDEHRSINSAARVMKLSYVKALRMLNQLEQCSGQVFLVRRRGGQQRGGTSLTPRALRFMEEYRRLDQAVQEQGQGEFARFELALEAEQDD